jgi:hypothetical protein
MMLSLGLAAFSPRPGLAQSVAAPSWASGGYRGASQRVQQPFLATIGDSNTTVVNGELVAQGASTGISQFEALSGGAATSVGAGGSTTTAVGNSLNITVTGSGNTVIVSNRQNNSKAISAISR